ncbi:DUF4386 domain-containing protein [Isoptericola sp. b441]|uniref:DUF4386 domain-containing protein n=1 Tax=Actinotalea lenta TaxID=3064654 RepID=A0ABT9D6A4_9CELL|nr:DUF4386 domain-containing protein [Isoptericola sp. b441]MDO8106365.1 DUF4386 domain-containing protein [Isoptericola sp. b441]
MSTTTESDTAVRFPQPAPPAAADRAAGVLPRRAARVAGVGYLVIYVLAVLANFGVRNRLVVDGDASATAANIAENLGLFRLGLVAFLAVFLVDLVIAWALHVALRRVHHDLSMLAAWSRLAYSVMLGAGLVFFAQVPVMLGGAYPDALGAATDAQVMLAVRSFDAAWLIGLAVFGLHLVLVAALLLRSGYAPRVLAALLALAGVAYLADTVAHLVLPDYGAVASVMLAVVALPSMVGEGWFGLWLLRTRRLPA